MQTLIRSKKTEFVAGPTGLQSYRARAIESCLVLVMKQGRLTVKASEMAAESQGFTAKWGGRNFRSWTHGWVKERKLPVSQQGHHGKVFLLLSDPTIKAELWTYIQSNKWAMDPMWLAEFIQGKLLPDITKKYIKHLVDEEMPCCAAPHLRVHQILAFSLIQQLGAMQQPPSLTAPPVALSYRSKTEFLWNLPGQPPIRQVIHCPHGHMLSATKPPHFMEI